ncbi:indole-3-glycerol phosphate synthase TrpC [Aminithiophilus ramosus]|uniref:Indole-3-glycerol phosphate synthase n=2 Tax=Synergistales TaxID=649776 RepID=A0A9Q7ALB8_9BACT|nr:indole-3-glycerol phosphate synthase TrpC [Aminithiophilus ramosus]QTX31807.1 indole-3-glycerol phosphate synthase TrpC [Aminithiophilus ramosus]QVL35630.1 indole-3-glycerol phosphate synthase TrpC [Synergistota bacterium]
MILDRIVRSKIDEVEGLRGKKRSLAAALAGPGVTVIAEVKKASPSKGLIRDDFDPLALARSYVAGGAGALSVLTDGPFFQGSREIFGQVRAAVDLPLLRKDFLIDPLQVYESLFLGADAVLLIVAVLGETIGAMVDLVASLGMESLVEVHDERELHLALETRSPLIGVNNRDLRDFTVDLALTGRLVAERDRLGDSRPVVAESGIFDRRDVERLEACGAAAVLVGEALVRSDDPAALIASLRGRR